MKVSKSAILTAILSFGMAVSPAMATVIDYSTTGVFNPPGSSSVLSGTNGGTLTFDSNSDTGDGTGTPGSPSTITLGGFSPDLPNSNSTISGSGNSFMLTVNQTIEAGGPTGSGTASATLSGSFSNSSGLNGTIWLTFSQPPSFQIDGVNYLLTDLQCGTLVVGCAANQTPNVLAISASGTTPITADISATPEPAFYGLTGVGLVGLFAMAIRRKQREA